MPLRPSTLRAVDVVDGCLAKVTGATAPSSATGCPSLIYRTPATRAHGPSSSRTGCRREVRELATRTTGVIEPDGPLDTSGTDS